MQLTIALTLSLVAACLAAPALPNIVQLAESDPALSTLVTAVSAGGLVGVLSGPGPFTVFAPTNDAFAALPPGVLQKLLQPANKPELVDILTYHVVAGAAVKSTQLYNHEQIKTVEGKNVTVFVASGSVYIDYAEVTTANLLASNGIVHIINKVLIPPKNASEVEEEAPALPNIVQLAQSDSDLSTLVTAVSAGGLVGTLSGPGPFTVFAPTNEAFAALPPGVLDHLLKPENKGELDEILTYHVVAGAAVNSSSLHDHERIKTVEGESVTIFITPSGNVYVDYAEVTTANLMASNGIVHIINKVLIPPHLALEWVAKRIMA